ncbi:hypothetical protein GCM10009096_03850 [Parasphingorhabdus litoris]|uniref:Cytochrome c assembly protein domain-containing protein n=2 Tax=Parasphingorhabdus litoris TaxID=394733 RepID=A0ABN1A382_9SPHN
MGVLFLAVAVVGFAPSFLFPILSGNFDFPLAVFIHAAIMFSWLGLFILQAVLASRGPSRIHKYLGTASLFLFILIMISGFTLSVANFLQDLPQPVEARLDSIFFLQLWTVVLIPLFYWLGYRKRRQSPDEHMRYMLLLTFFLIEAAASRITFLPGMLDDATFIYAQYIYLDLMLVPLFIFDWQQLGRLSKATIIGCSILLFYQCTALVMWDNELWLKTTDILDNWFRTYWPI